MHTIHATAAIVAHPKATGWLLGSNSHTRLTIKRMLFCYSLLWVIHAMRAGMAMAVGLPLENHGWPMAFDLLWMSACFILIRFEVSTVWKNTALINWQIGFALASLLMSFVLIEAGRSAALLLTVVILAVGFYQLNHWQILRSGMLAWGLMTTCHWVLNLASTPGINSDRDTLTLLATAMILPWLSAVAQKVNQNQAAYHEQKRVLTRTLTRLGELKTHDALTGLTDHKHMQALLDAECKRHVRNELTFSVALFSIERLHEINYRYGVAQGDAMIRQWSQLATQHLRSSDVVARWSLHEFLILMPETNLQGAHRSVERLSDFLSTQWGFYSEGCWTPMDCTVGVTHFRSADTTTLLIQRVEQALRDARRKIHPIVENIVS